MRGINANSSAYFSLALISLSLSPASCAAFSMPSPPPPRGRASSSACAPRTRALFGRCPTKPSSPSWCSLETRGAYLPTCRPRRGAGSGGNRGCKPSPWLGVGGLAGLQPLLQNRVWCAGSSAAAASLLGISDSLVPPPAPHSGLRALRARTRCSRLCSHLELSAGGGEERGRGRRHGFRHRAGWDGDYNLMKRNARGSRLQSQTWSHEPMTLFTGGPMHEQKIFRKCGCLPGGGLVNFSKKQVVFCKS